MQIVMLTADSVEFTLVRILVEIKSANVCFGCRYCTELLVQDSIRYKIDQATGAACDQGVARDNSLVRFPVLGIQFCDVH